VSVEQAQTLSLFVATITMGLMAGVFGLYAHTIMRGLGRTDDRTFVGAFQAIDRAIINPLFMLAFMGALISSAVAAAVHLRSEDSTERPWVLVACGLYLVTVVITFVVNLPLNDAIKAAGDPSAIADLEAVRHGFQEKRWAAWNIVRTIACTVSFGCLAWALVLHGRAT
jgi:uncharacterized membrane protein